MSNDAPDRLEGIQSLKGIERLVNRARQRLNETEMDYQSLEYWQSFFKQELEKKTIESDELDRERYGGIEIDERRWREIEDLQKKNERKIRKLKLVVKELDRLDEMLRNESNYASSAAKLWYEIHDSFKDEYSDE